MEENKRYNKGFRDGIFYTLFICIAIVIIVVLWKGILEKVTSRTSTLEGTYSEESGVKTGVLRAYIDKYYIDDVDEAKVLEGMYGGMIDALEDPYSVYYTKEEYEQLQESMDGTYYGIGVSALQSGKTGTITFVKVFSTSPAKEAGIKDGDILYSVNGVSVEGKDLSTVVTEIRGEKGTKVKLTVVRDGKYLDFEVERREVEMDTVSYHMLDNNIGYLYISEFDGVTTEQTKNAINDLVKQGMQSIIVDIRDNPGGRLDVIEDVMDMFISKDKLLMYMKTKAGERTEYYSETVGMIPDMPMAMLINGNSASASELFCGAMQCYDRATLIGTTTFGKGIVQSIFPLGDGTALKLTTAKYYLPNDENIHEVGVKPDVTVELPEGVKSCWELTEDKDNQLQEAIKILTEK